MRVLYIHAEFFSYKPREKVNIPAVDDCESKEVSFNDVLVIFMTIEKGDFQEKDRIIKEFINDLDIHVKRINCKNIVIYPYAHLSESLESPRLALRMLRVIESSLKKRFGEYKIHKAPFGWYKEFVLKCIGHPLAELSRSFK